MEALTFECPRCDQPYDYDADYDGRKVQCQACSVKFFVRATAEGVHTQLAEVAGEAGTRAPNVGTQSSGLQAAVADSVSATQLGQDFKCPRCGQQYDWDAALSGRKVQCQKCAVKFFVQETAEGVRTRLAKVAKQDGVRVPAAGARRLRVLTTDADRLLTASLGSKLLGQELRTDLYSRNGFRLLGVSASSDRQTLLSVAGRLQTMVRMSPKALSRFAIKTGYDHQLERGEIELSVSRLQDPRHRLVQEIFWPHISNGAFSEICKSRQLATPEVLAALDALAQAGGNQREGVLAQHALAVAYHNLALAGEIKWILGESAWDGGPWEKALALWAQVITGEEFWDYLRERAEAFSDPRLRPADVDQIRSELPSVVLGFNLVLSRYYARTNDAELCRSHLALIAAADLPAEAINACMADAVKTLAVMRLEPLVRRAENPLDAGEDDDDDMVASEEGEEDEDEEEATGQNSGLPKCPKGHGRVRLWGGDLRCWKCGWEPAGSAAKPGGGGKSRKKRRKKTAKKKKKKQAVSDRKVSREEFEELYRPILDEAFAVRDYLTGDVGIDPELVALSEFDRICEAILGASNSKIDYDNPNRERDIVYSMLVAQQLLSLPLSRHARRKIEASLRSDRRILYRGFELPGDVDPTECWFAEGEVVDPDSCLLFPYHKVTGRELKVDVVQSSAGVRVSYESRRILVPRSARARAVHEGTPVGRKLFRVSGREDDSLFCPPSTSVPPLDLGKDRQADSILAVLEHCVKHWGPTSKYLTDGSLADWFEQRGQVALASKLRECAKETTQRKDTLAALRLAAAAELDDTAKTLERRAELQAKEEEAQATEETRTVEAKRDADVGAHDERTDSRKSELTSEVKTTKAQCESERDEERQKADAAVEQECAAAAAPIAAAEQEYERHVAPYRGPRAACRWELRYGAVGAGVGAGLALFIPLDLLTRLGEAGSAPGTTSRMQVVVVGGLAIGVVAMLFAGALRWMARVALARPVSELKRERDLNCARLLDACKEKVSEIEGIADSKIAALESELASIAEGRNQLIRTAEEKLRQIRDSCDASVRGFREECSQTVRRLEQRLGICFAVKSKSDASRFPAFKKARSSGYKEGKEPSSSEMQMTFSEEQEAKAKLQMAMRLMGRF